MKSQTPQKRSLVNVLLGAILSRSGKVVVRAKEGIYCL